MKESLSRMKWGQATSVCALALLFCLVFSGSAQASIIAPAGSPNPFPPDPFGACVGCTQLKYTSSGLVTSSNGKVVFTLNAAVYNDPGAVAGIRAGGGLDFVYQVINTTASQDNVGRVTAIDFTGFMTDIGYSTAGEPAAGGTAFVTGTGTPGQITRFVPGDTVGWDFTAGGGVVAMVPGTTSVVLVVKTDATNFKPGNANVIDGGVSTVAAYEPAAPTGGVPEPASMALLGGGLLALAGIRRFRHQ